MSLAICIKYITLKSYRMFRQHIFITKEVIATGSLRGLKSEFKFRTENIDEYGPRSLIERKIVNPCQVSIADKNLLKMSTYTDYNKASRIYDNQRIAVGADIMAAMVQFHSGEELQDLYMLDAGCGTGNYAKALIEMGVRQISLLDASSGMLEKAKCKLGDDIERGMVKDIIEGKMPSLPFPDKTFECVMFNGVLNHLDRDDPAFPNAVKTLRESVRILRPNGLIIVSTILPETMSRNLWYSQLNMDLTNRFNASILPSVEQFDKMFADAGIKCIQKLNLLGSDMFKTYDNVDGPLDESWRGTFSYWSFASEEEVSHAIEKVKALKSQGEYEKWVKAHDYTTSSGVTTIFICKPRPTKKE